MAKSDYAYAPQRIQQEQETDFMTYTGGEEDSFGLDDLAQDHNYSIIEKQMMSRFGMSEKTYDRQEVIDKWVNYNRKFNVGNTLSVLGEASYLSKADDKEKFHALNSYKLWDNMKGAFDGGTAAQKLDNVYDYGVALIMDPLNLVTFGAGKLLSGGATKAAAGVAEEGLKIATNKILKKAGKQGSKVSDLTPALKAEIDQARRRVLAKTMNREAVEGVEKGAIESALKTVANKELARGAAVETLGMITIDSIQQRAAYMKVGFQEEFNVLNTALIAGGGFFGYGLAKTIPHLSGTKLPTSVALDVFDAAQGAEAAAKTLARTESKKEAKQKLDEIMADDTQRTAFVNDLRKSTIAAEDWAKTVMEGRQISASLSDENLEAIATQTDEAFKAFLVGDEKTFGGLLSIFNKAGLTLDKANDPWKHVSHFQKEVIKDMPDELKQEVKRLYDATLLKYSQRHKGITDLDEGMSVFAAELSASGTKMHYQGLFMKGLEEAKTKKRSFKDTKGITPEDLLVGELDPHTGAIKNLPEKQKEGFFEGMQRRLIQLLVTHPATVALNLYGWSNTTALSTASDMLRAGLYKGEWAARHLVGNEKEAVEAGKKAKLLLDLQGRKIRNLMNPFATKEEVLNLLSANPKQQKELFRYIAGGIDSKDVLKSINVNFDDIEKPGIFDKIVDGMQTVYGVKAVDILTKTQEYMYNIDKQIIKKYGMSYSEFIGAKADVLDDAGKKIGTQPLNWDKMRSDEFVEIQSLAVQDSLRNVFSKSYAGNEFNKSNRTLIERVAGEIEAARAYPVIGAMIPFGQFFNNTIAFMADYSGISAVHGYFTQSGRHKADPFDMFTKGAVGLTAGYAASEYEMKNLGQGLAWHEDRDDDGQVISKLYDFPFSFWKGVGRIFAHLRQDGTVPKELYIDIRDTFGPANLTRSLGETNKMLGDLALDAASGDIPDLTDGLAKLLGGAGSLYLSGFSRPLDPINQIAAFSMGEAYNETDRNIGSKFANNSVRYVESIFDAFEYWTGVETISAQQLITGGIADAPKQTKQRALEERERSSPIGRLFGYRESAAPNSLDKIFADIGMPEWKNNIKANIPEANNTMNRVITKHLEYEAEKAISKPNWETLPQKTKQKTLNKVIERAKKRAMRELFRGSSVDKRHALMYDISKSGGNVKIQDIELALEELGIDKKATDLSTRELRLLNNFFKIQKRKEKREVRKQLR
tara:strand:- start:2 stop:3637 length:3636 start_codon:yes stop_codon:yes gene_type:complete